MYDFDLISWLFKNCTYWVKGGASWQKANENKEDNEMIIYTSLLDHTIHSGTLWVIPKSKYDEYLKIWREVLKNY